VVCLLALTVQPCAHCASMLCKMQVLKISLVIGDAAGIRSALHEWQEKYSKTKAIAAHCPTCWAITLLIPLDVLDSQDALRALVESCEWKDLAKTSSNSGAGDFQCSVCEL